MDRLPSDFRLRHGILLGIILSAGVPWYWADNTVRPFILGLPIWAFVSLAMSLVLAVTAAWIIMRHWKDDE